MAAGEAVYFFDCKAATVYPSPVLGERCYEGLPGVIPADSTSMKGKVVYGEAEGLLDVYPPYQGAEA